MKERAKKNPPVGGANRIKQGPGYNTREIIYSFQPSPKTAPSFLLSQTTSSTKALTCRHQGGSDSKCSPKFGNHNAPPAVPMGFNALHISDDRNVVVFSFWQIDERLLCLYDVRPLPQASPPTPHEMESQDSEKNTCHGVHGVLREYTIFTPTGSKERARTKKGGTCLLLAEPGYTEGLFC